MADKPVTREEKYLAYLTGDYKGEIPKPITRKEKYLYELCLKGIGGEISPEEIKNAVNEYLEKNPVKPGATTEQAQQIEQNKTNIALLKEDISNKITKFYASNQGETHVTDSDNGKIMDMMLYGKSEQFTTTGKNLLKIKDGTQTTRGITVTAKDGVVALKGTATETGWALFDIDSFVLDGMCILSSNISTDVRVVAANKSFKSVLEQGGSVTLENAEVSKVCFTVTEGETYDISNILIQIEKGSEATAYEPYTGGIPSPNPDYPQEIKSVVNPTVKMSNEDGTKSQTVTLPYTLNAIPVSSGGNVTINGQKYIADYVDVERGKVVRNVENVTFNGAENENWELWNADKEKMWSFMFVNSLKTFTNESVSKCNRFEFNVNENIDRTFWLCNPSGMPSLQIKNRIIGKDITAFKSWLSNNPINVIYPLRIPIEEELTAEHAQALKELATYYPVTNISIGSEQLDGYTVFNYPISMANGWNYVKKQLNDNRDYIYDMDIQSAEAYVNSEYAVALTELEV